MLNLKREFVFDGSFTIPEHHASTLVETSPGNYCVAWFGGTKESHQDVSIWYALRQNGVWSAPKQIERVLDEPHWNPVLFCDEDQILHLFYKIGFKIPTWQTWYVTSGDGGQSWSSPKGLVPGAARGRGPVKNKPIKLSNGDWLAPASIEESEWWEAFVDRSCDNGKTWTASDLIEMDRAWFIERQPNGGKRGVIQPTLWESSPGHVHMLLRSSAGLIMRSDSTDFGHTWCCVYPTELPNNNSGIDLAKLDDGRLALLYNPIKENWGGRNPLSLAISDDNGTTWRKSGDVEYEEPTDEYKQEFSYPAIIPTVKGVAMCYTWHRRNIAFVEMDAGVF